MGRYLLETSIAVKLLKAVYRKYCKLENWADGVYRSSGVYTMTKLFWDEVIIAFRYSFLGRTTEIGEGECNAEILYNSKVVKWTLTSYNNWKYRVLNYSNTSKMVNSVVEVKKELYFLPVKTGGIIIFTAILTNMILFLLLHKEIGILGWGMRGLLLFVGFFGIFCKIGWQELKKTSWFIRYMETHCQKG